MIRVFPILSLLFFVGCSTPQHSWQNSQRNTVWTAMVAAANAPDYESEDPRKRWIVLENLVDVDASTSKILVHRLLGRSLQLPRQNEQVDNREWIFTIRLLPNNPPTATFDSMQPTFIPARLLDEANRYFATVDGLLQSALE